MDFTILDKTQKYLVAVSGGPDSMYLLDNLLHNEEFDANNFIVCHVNYHKRKDSSYDEEIVREYCLSHHIKFYCKEVLEEEYKQYYSNNHNFQAIARQIRYDFFIRIALQENCQGVIIAHNMTDHIETYLLQKKRHSIVTHYGLNPISNYTSIVLYPANITLLRPMLKVAREEIIAYLTTHHLKYAIDSSNLLGVYQRNVIRQHLQEDNLVCYLTEINNLNLEDENIKQIVTDYFQDSSSLKISLFRQLPSLLTQQMVLYNFFKLNNKLNLIQNKKRKFLAEVCQQLVSLKPNIIIPINQQYSLVKSYDYAEIIDNEYFNLCTIIIFEPHGKEEYLWKNHRLITPANEEDAHFKVLDSDFPLTITNDHSVLSQATWKGKKLTRWWIKNKIPVTTRKSFHILTKDKRVIMMNFFYQLSEYNDFNDVIGEKNKIYYFMLK